MLEAADLRELAPELARLAGHRLVFVNWDVGAGEAAVVSVARTKVTVKQADNWILRA